MNEDGAVGIEHHRLDADLAGLDKVIQKCLQADAGTDQAQASIAVTHLYVEPHLELTGDHRAIDVDGVGCVGLQCLEEPLVARAVRGHHIAWCIAG